MEHQLTIFLGTFTTLLAVINPFETLPIFLSFSKGQDNKKRRKLAFRSCLYALILVLSFLLLGTYLLRIFGVDLSMVRTVGGIILAKIGFDLFNNPTEFIKTSSGSNDQDEGDPAFVPLAMPIMFGPGAMAIVLGMTSMKTQSNEVGTVAMVAIAALACIAVMFTILAFAEPIVKRIGQKGLDAATRIVGFFVATMGIGLIFHGVGEFLATYIK